MNKLLLLQILGSESQNDDQAKIHQKQQRFAQLVGVGAYSLKSLRAAEEHIEHGKFTFSLMDIGRVN
jgi:hypothetical protein